MTINQMNLEEVQNNLLGQSRTGIDTRSCPETAKIVKISSSFESMDQFVMNMVDDFKHGASNMQLLSNWYSGHWTHGLIQKLENGEFAINFIDSKANACPEVFKDFLQIFVDALNNETKEMVEVQDRTKIDDVQLDAGQVDSMPMQEVTNLIAEIEKHRESMLLQADEDLSCGWLAPHVPYIVLYGEPYLEILRKHRPQADAGSNDDSCGWAKITPQAIIDEMCSTYPNIIPKPDPQISFSSITAEHANISDYVKCKKIDKDIKNLILVSDIDCLAGQLDALKRLIEQLTDIENQEWRQELQKKYQVVQEKLQLVGYYDNKEIARQLKYSFKNERDDLALKRAIDTFINYPNSDAYNVVMSLYSNLSDQSLKAKYHCLDNLSLKPTWRDEQKINVLIQSFLNLKDSEQNQNDFFTNFAEFYHHLNDHDRSLAEKYQNIIGWIISHTDVSLSVRQSIVKDALLPVKLTDLLEEIKLHLSSGPGSDAILDRLIKCFRNTCPSTGMIPGETPEQQELSKMLLSNEEVSLSSLREILPLINAESMSSLFRP